ncbi:Fpg/Nei family DNA glycosylase [Paenibacillus soyae]|uniref:Formamidopyrimidine-DNA glycosylase n=1 Tax=Paenibacillus soyae TaxID=2969249 RepID=A0A9X2S9M1_9BACL|nr:DNA-formamidopyrimidine glycosylase family protein [Paenibacillus soyae]MCR2802882.1 endonuclease VIII [Paenibacillus soyae]
MQELPEVDIYRAMLAERYAGAQVTAMHIHKELRESDGGHDVSQDVVGQSIWFVERRAQHLVFHLDNGKRFLIHMSDGVTAYCGLAADSAQPSEPALSLDFQERRLSFFGLRAGDLSIMSVKGLEGYMKTFGLDPLDKRVTPSRLKERFAKKRSSLKTALMDEKLMTGIGNVYSDEIAFEARIRPETKVAVLGESEWERLHAAIVHVLREAISHGGIGESPLFEGDILTGGYRERLQVYNRAGEACHRCGGSIQRIAVGSRKAFACDGCQNDSSSIGADEESLPQ